MLLPGLTRESMGYVTALQLLFEALGKIVIVEIRFTVFRSVSSGHELLEAQEGWAWGWRQTCTELHGAAVFHGDVPVSVHLSSNSSVWWAVEREAGKVSLRYWCGCGCWLAGKLPKSLLFHTLVLWAAGSDGCLRKHFMRSFERSVSFSADWISCINVHCWGCLRVS